MRNQTLIGTIIIAVFSLILAMPVAALANHMLGFEGFSIGRFVWLNLSLGALVMVALGVPIAAAVRRRQVRAAARVGAVPTRAKVISVREVPVQSKRIG